MKPFSQYSKTGGQFNKRLQKFWQWIQTFSGGETIQFLIYILQHTHQGRKILEQIELIKVNKIVESTKTLHERAIPAKKHKVICALSRSGLTKKFLVKKGLKIGDQQYATARKKFDQAYEEKIYKSASCLTNCQNRTSQPDLMEEVDLTEKYEVEQTLSLKRNKPEPSQCICGREWDEVDSKMVGCDECQTWFHISCIGLKEEDIPEGNWYCKTCLEKKKRKTIREVNLSPEKIQLRDIVEEYSSPIKNSPQKEFTFSSPLKEFPVSPIKATQRRERISTGADKLSLHLDIFDKEESDDEEELLANPFEVKKDIKKKTTTSQTKKKKKQTKHQTQQKKKVKATKSKKKNQPVGLVRDSNSCFVISVLQCLLNNSPWRRKLLNLTDDPDPAIRALCEIVKLSELSNDAIDPGDFNLLDHVEFNSLFSRHIQDDAHALFLHLIEKSTQLKEENGFFTTSKITCQQHEECLNTPVFSEPEELNSLALPLAPNTSIQQLINMYFESEEVEAKCYQTEGHPLVKSSKCFSWTAFPELLTIQLKRFSNNGEKITSKISISEDLIFSGYTYSLSSIVVHKGRNINSGHYICYSTYRGSLEWYKIDDEKVSKVSKEQVRTEGGKNGYLLIYSYQFDDLMDGDQSTPVEKEEKQQPLDLEDEFLQQEDTPFIPASQTTIQSNGLIDLFEYANEINLLNLNLQNQDWEMNLMGQIDFNALENRLMEMAFFDFYTKHVLAPTHENNDQLEQQFCKMIKPIDSKSSRFKNEILETCPGVFFSCNTFTRFFGTKWYSDVIIITFLDQLSTQYSCKYVDSDFPIALKTKMDNNQDFSKMLQKNNLQAYIHQIKSDVLGFVFFPIHLPGHWIIGVLSAKGFAIFDPMNNDKVLLDPQVICLTTLFEQNDIQTYFQYNPNKISHQQDAYNCGVYCLLYAHALVEGHSIEEIFNFSSTDIITFRIFVALLLEQKYNLSERLPVAVRDLEHEESENENSVSLGSDIQFEDQDDNSSSISGGAEDISEDDDLFNSATDLMQNYEENMPGLPRKHKPKQFYNSQSTTRLSVKKASKINFGNKTILLYKCDFNHKYIPNQECGYETVDRSNMRRHLNIHFHEKPFACTKCDKSFSQNQSLKRHLETVHKEKTIEHKKLSKRGGKPIDIKVQKHINAWLSENSSPSSQTMEVDGITRQIFTVPFSWLHMHQKYLEEESSFKISRPTFLKYKLPCFKRSRKRTDLCEHCAKEPYFKKDLSKAIENGDLKSEQEIQAKLDILHTHKLRAQHQRTEFKNSISNLTEGQAVLLLDFKENVKLGGNKNEIGAIFYNKQQRAVLGFIIFYKVGSEIKQKKIVFVSEILSKDGLFVVKAMETLLKSSTFRRLKISNLRFWSDGGPHFKCFEVLHFVRSLKKSKEYPLLKKVSSSFFIEHHGKNPVDSLFGQITNILSEYERSNEEIINTQQLIQVLQENFQRISGNEDLNTKIWKLDNYEREKLYVTRLIPGRATVINPEDPQEKTQEEKKKKKRQKNEEALNTKRTRKPSSKKKSQKDQKKEDKRKKKKKETLRRRSKRNLGYFRFTDFYHFEMKKNHLVKARVLTGEQNFVYFKCSTQASDDERKLKINTKSPPQTASMPYMDRLRTLKKETRRGVLTSLPSSPEAIKLLKKKLEDELPAAEYQEQENEPDEEEQELEIEGIPEELRGIPLSEEDINDFKYLQSCLQDNNWSSFVKARKEWKWYHTLKQILN